MSGIWVHSCQKERVILVMSILREVRNKDLIAWIMTNQNRRAHSPIHLMRISWTALNLSIIIRLLLHPNGAITTTNKLRTTRSLIDSHSKLLLPLHSRSRKTIEIATVNYHLTRIKSILMHRISKRRTNLLKNHGHH